MAELSPWFSEGETGAETESIPIKLLQGGPKKKRTGDFLQNSQNIGPMNLKINMHNPNTYSYQCLKYEILNFKAS